MRNAIVSILIVCSICLAADQNIVNNLNLNGNTLKRVGGFTKSDNTAWNLVDSTTMDAAISAATNAVGAIWDSRWVNVNGDSMGSLTVTSPLIISNMAADNTLITFIEDSGAIKKSIGYDENGSYGLGAFNGTTPDVLSTFSVADPTDPLNAATKAYVDDAFAAVTMPAKTIRVATSGGDYTTLASAIANASDGDVILIAPGTYTSDEIVLTKSITIEGMSSNPRDVILVPSASTVRFMDIGSTLTASINNVTIKDCFASSVGGGAIKSVGASSYIYIDNCIFTNCQTDVKNISGAAIYCSSTSGELVIKNSDFYGCISYGSGGAICINSSGSFKSFIKSCRFYNCTALGSEATPSPVDAYGGAVYTSTLTGITELDDIYAEGCIVDAGTGVAAGGAVYMYNNARITNFRTYDRPHNRTNGLCFRVSSTIGSMIVTNNGVAFGVVGPAGL